jgi:hypothetical protein
MVQCTGPIKGLVNLGQPSPRRPVVARDVQEYSPPAPAPSPATVGAAQPAQQPVIVQPPQVTGFRLMALPLLDGFIQQNTVCASCISSSVCRVIRQEITLFATILNDKGMHRAPELAQNFLSHLHRRDQPTVMRVVLERTQLSPSRTCVPCAQVLAVVWHVRRRYR